VNYYPPISFSCVVGFWGKEWWEKGSHYMMQTDLEFTI
jgi:hypothetical protein